MQTQNLALIAAADVMIALGVEDGELPDEFIAEATQLAAIRCAQAVLVSFYPEAQATGPSATYAAAYLAGVQGLAERLHWSAFRLQ